MRYYDKLMYSAARAAQTVSPKSFASAPAVPENLALGC